MIKSYFAINLKIYYADIEMFLKIKKIHKTLNDIFNKKSVLRNHLEVYILVCVKRQRENFNRIYKTSIMNIAIGWDCG